MGVRFRFGKKVAFLKLDKLTGQPKLGNLFWSLTLGKRFASALTFRVTAVGREGLVPTVDVRPIALGA